MSKHILPAFHTPLANYRWPQSDAHNQELQGHILTLEENDGGVVRSNVGGWHSGSNFFDDDSDCIRKLREQLLAFVDQLTEQVCGRECTLGLAPEISGWANVLREGQYNSPHSHPNAMWSGVYYVTENPAIDGHPFSGKLELMDPRPGASIQYQDNNKLYGRFLLSPVAGQMIIFPSWLVHHVHPYFGSDARISIAFNVCYA
ncbi:MAG: TIGR02466 family protein [Pseudomonadota bacterium]